MWGRGSGGEHTEDYKGGKNDPQTLLLHFKGSCQSSHIPAIVCLCHSAGYNLPHVHTQTHMHRRAVKLHRVFREQTVFLVTNQSDSRTCDQALPRERKLHGKCSCLEPAAQPPGSVQQAPTGCQAAGGQEETHSEPLSPL